VGKNEKVMVASLAPRRLAALGSAAANVIVASSVYCAATSRLVGVLTATASESQSFGD